VLLSELLPALAMATAAEAVVVVIVLFAVTTVEAASLPKGSDSDDGGLAGGDLSMHYLFLLCTYKF